MTTQNTSIADKERVREHVKQYFGASCWQDFEKRKEELRGRQPVEHPRVEKQPSKGEALISDIAQYDLERSVAELRERFERNQAKLAELEAALALKGQSTVIRTDVLPPFVGSGYNIVTELPTGGYKIHGRFTGPFSGEPEYPEVVGGVTVYRSIRIRPGLLVCVSRPGTAYEVGEERITAATMSGALQTRYLYLKITMDEGGSLSHEYAIYSDLQNQSADYVLWLIGTIRGGYEQIQHWEQRWVGDIALYPHRRCVNTHSDAAKWYLSLLVRYAVTKCEDLATCPPDIP